VEEQKEEGKKWEVNLEEEEVEECIRKQGDKRALGENGVGRKVVKMMWECKGGRRKIMGIYRRSLELGYMVKRWRRSVGIVMKKPKKQDYSLPSSYRVINLLDVLGKGLERVVNGRLERGKQVGMGDEQFEARKGRRGMEVVGSLYRKCEEGGGKGLLSCMDVKGVYENLRVRKMEKRLEELGVEKYLREWIVSFLRERVVRVKIGGRIGGRVKMRGETVQGSALSSALFMFLLEGVLEEVMKEEVEGVSMVAVVDDVGLMVVGKDEEEIRERERVRRMEIGLVRGWKKWEIDVQMLKLEGVWRRKGRKRWVKEVRWLGEDIVLK